MSSEQLSAVAGVVLSLVFAYVPGLREWFAGLAGDYKRVIMLVCLAAVAAGAFGLSCGGIVQTVSCTQDGAVGLLSAFVAALIANQAAYVISPETEDVRRAKADRWLNLPTVSSPPASKP